MNQDYPELQQFLAGYFNQDWVDDHKSADGVINYFISDSSEETKTIVQRELDRLISPKSEEIVIRLLVSNLAKTLRWEDFFICCIFRKLCLALGGILIIIS